MKISLEQKQELKDTEVLIRYPELSEQVKHIEQVLYAMNQTIEAKCDGRICKISPAEVYYIESVDKRTYIYCTKEVYETTEKLYQFEENLSSAGFVRASKKCIVNKYHLKEIKILPNSHIEALLTNEERLVVTRKYISEIRKALEQK